MNPMASAVIRFNNFENTNSSVRLNSADNVNAAYNWWGTTDTQAISQKIYDNKNDFNLGTVTFVPFLTEPNSQAPVATNIPLSITTPTPTTSPTNSPMPTSTPYQEPQQTKQEVIIGAAITATVIVAGLGSLIYLIKRK
jgi:hypothetical protein